MLENQRTSNRKKKLRSLAVIPARAGSERIKNKNIVGLAKKPLIAYTLHDIINSKCFDRVLVSTDSQEIADISRKNGAEVPFLRSPETSGAGSDLLDAIAEVLDRLQQLEGYAPDILGIFLPTAPFRHVSKIKKIHTELIHGAQAGNLLKPIKLNQDELYYRDSSDNIHKCNVQKKDKGAVYLLNILSVVMYNLDWPSLKRIGVTRNTKGYFNHYLSWFRKNDYLFLDAKERKNFYDSSRRWVYVAYASMLESIDINTPQDLAFAEKQLKRYEKIQNSNLDFFSKASI